MSGVVGRFGVWLVAAALVVGFGSWPAAAEGRLLSDSDLSRLVPGSLIHIHTPIGTSVPMKFDPDGTVEGRAGAVAFYLGSNRDSGRWWVEDGRLCHHWKVWFRAKPRCIEIRKNGNSIHWRDRAGDTGTATIVSGPSPERPRAERAAAVRPVVRTAGLVPASNRPQTPPANVQPVVARAATSDDVRAVAVPQRAAPRRSQPSPTATSPAQATQAQQRRALRRARRRARRRAMRAPPPPMPRPSRRVHRRPGADEQRRLTYRIVRVRDDDVLNIRSAPSAEADRVGAIPPEATGVRVLAACDGDWCPVAYGGARGWVHSAYLAPEMSRARARLARRGRIRARSAFGQRD